jgi:hypothetical protein
MPDLTSSIDAPGFGPTIRNPDGTFGCTPEHADDPWDMLPVNVRRSLKQRITAHAKAKGEKTAAWARRQLEAALEAEGG